MCVTICGKFRSDEGAVASYGNRIRVKSPAKWGVQIAGMIFQTHSSNQSAKDMEDICIWYGVRFATLNYLCIKVLYELTFQIISFKIVNYEIM